MVKPVRRCNVAARKESGKSSPPTITMHHHLEKIIKHSPTHGILTTSQWHRQQSLFSRPRLSSILRILLATRKIKLPSHRRALPSSHPNLLLSRLTHPHPNISAPHRRLPARQTQAKTLRALRWHRTARRLGFRRRLQEPALRLDRAAEHPWQHGRGLEHQLPAETSVFWPFLSAEVFDRV